MHKIAIFASGTGSNAKEIIEYFNHSKQGTRAATIALVVCNKPEAGVNTIAEKNNIPVLIIEKEKFFEGNGYVDELKEQGIDFIVLAGFLWKIPSSLLKAFHNRIINIHPALLPKYGGKGMYGQRVHQAVVDNKEKESGITIHYVDDVYDNGDIIFQINCPVMNDDTPESLAQRIQQLEHEHYPRIIEKVVKSL